MSARRTVLVCLAGLFVLGAGAVFAAGEYLSQPVPRLIGAAPSSLPAASVTIPTARGSVAGWYARGVDGGGSVLLLHGVRADRRQMLARAQFLSRQGYGVLLIDLQAHGESPGDHITFGAREAAGVTAALAFLAHDRPVEKIGVIGVSLGAASLVLAHPGKAISALVIESMYPTIEDAVENRLQTALGQPGRMLAPLLLQQMPLRLGVQMKDLRTIDAVAQVACPVLVASGAEDRHTTANETRRIYGAAPQPKQLWLVQGAAHVDLHAFGAAVYEKKISDFLSAYLRR